MILVIVNQLVVSIHTLRVNSNSSKIFGRIRTRNICIVVLVVNACCCHIKNKSSDCHNYRHTNCNDERDKLSSLHLFKAFGNQFRMLKIIEQVSTALISVFCRRLYASVNDNLDTFGQFRVPLSYRGIRLTVSRIHTGKQMMHCHAQCENVGSRVSLTTVLLWRSITLSAKNCCIRKILLFILSCYTEVDNLDISFRLQHYVRRFHISINN